MTSLLIVLAMPDAVIARYERPLKAHFPALEINAVNHRDKIDPYIARADILLSFGAMMADEVFAKAKSLKWMQVLGTGVDRVTDSPSLRPEVVVTNMPGIHGAPVAETAITAMLALSRDLPRSVRAQDRHAWERFPSRLLDGKTAAIFGLGVIAEALAPRLKALGMTVVGISSAPRALPGFDRLLPRERLEDGVAACDHFILLTPHTPATYRIVGERVIRAMRRGAFFVNLGRGETVDEDALLRALEDGHVAGAALDVFSVEPLPPDHAFWRLKSVIVTPHLGGFYDEYPDRCWPVIEGNLKRFLAGDTRNMIHLVPRP